LAQELACAQAINSAIASQGGSVRRRDGLTTGESLVAAAIARLVHPCSKRAWAEWAAQSTLPARLEVKAEALTRQHFWDQMDAVPVQAVEEAEQAVVSKLLQVEALAPGLLAYDTTNFYTHLDTAKGRSVLAQRGHNKQRRHDLRQLGLALVVSEEGQIPLTHVLYEGSRNDVRSFQKLLEPLRRRLNRLWRQAQQLTLVFDQGAESRENLSEVRGEGDHYVTALRSSDHKKLLAEAAGKLEPLSLPSGQTVRAWRTQGVVEGQEQTRVVVWSEGAL
jgi:transposase